MENNFDCLLLASGGMDSTVLAYKLAKENKNVVILFIDYGQHCKDKEYQTLLKKQLLWLNKNSDIVRKKSIILYNAYISGALYKNIYERCCNFPLLEVKCDEYNKEKVLI